MRLEYFDMIDRVTAIDLSARRIETVSTVPDASPIFEGHFPGHPIVPGVLLTETMAQASGFLLLKLYEFARMPFLMAVDRARFRDFVPPRTVLEVRAELDHEGSGYAATKAKIAAAGKHVADAHLRFRIMPFPGELEDTLRERASRIGLEGATA